MSIEIIKSDRRKKEEIAGKYMQEIRDIVNARLSRRELLRMGLVMGGAGLLAMHGMQKFRPYWAHAQINSGNLKLISPKNTPSEDQLPIPEPVRPTVLNPAPTKGPNLSLSALNGFTEADRPDHQRWTQFGGVSDTLPGFDGPQYELIAKEVVPSFYPERDGILSYPIWMFVDATNPSYVGPLRFNAHYGEPIVVRIHNALPEDNHGYGINQTSTHLHNGHNGWESDGGPIQFYDKGFFKDYHYPNVRAGFSKTHPTSTYIDADGRSHEVPGDFRETISFQWFHEHRFDFTAQNVYKGLAGFYTLFSNDINLDTGDETTGLRLPSGEYDIPLIFADKVFDPTTGEMFFDLFNLDGMLGDKNTVNGKIQPFLEVKRRKYRFRFLDGGPSRVYEFFLSNGQPFTQISNDGNLLPKPLVRQSIRLGVAERADVIIDFSKYRRGTRIRLQNRLEQVNGRGPTGKILNPGDNVLEFMVGGDAQDDSQIPDKLLDLPSTDVSRAQIRPWHFERRQGAWVINGEFFSPDVVRAFSKQNTAESWILTTGGGWLHPVHIHLEEFRILSRNGGPPPKEEIARKDIVRIGQNAVGSVNTGRVELFLQFRDFLGKYPMHCHNTVHEDHAMMLLWEVVE